MDSIKIMFSVIGNTVKYILDFGFFFLTRLFFNIEVIGQYATILSFLLMFTFVLSLGFEVTYISVVSKITDEEYKAKCNGTFLFFRIIQILIYVVLVSSFFRLFPISQEDIYIFFLLFFATIIEFIAKHIFEFFLVSRRNIFVKALITTLVSLMKIVLLITFQYFLSKTIWLLVYILFISNVIYLILNIVFLRKIRIRGPTREFITKFLRIAFPFFLSSSLFIILNNFDVLLITLWSTNIEVANYFTAKQLYQFFVTLSMGISFILLSIFSNNISSGNINKNYDLIKKIDRLLNLTLIPIVFLIILYSNKITLLLLGKDYNLTSYLFSILSIKLILLSLEIAYKVQLKAVEKTKVNSMVTVVQSILTFILLIIFIHPNFLNKGVIGGAYALVLGWALTLIIFRPILYKKYEFGFYWGSFRNIGIMFCILLIQVYINMLIKYPIIFIPLFMLLDIFLYFSLNYLFRGFTKTDIIFFFNIIKFKNIKKSIYSEFKSRH